MTKDYYGKVRSFLLELKNKGQLGGIDLENTLNDPIIDILLQSSCFLASTIEDDIERQENRMYHNVLSAIFPFFVQPKPSISIVELLASSEKKFVKVMSGTLVEVYEEKTYNYTTVSDETIWPIEKFESKFIEYDEITNTKQYGSFFILLRVSMKTETEIDGSFSLYIQSISEQLDEKILLSILSENRDLFIIDDDDRFFKIGKIFVKEFVQCMKTNYTIPRALNWLNNFMLSSKTMMFFDVELNTKLKFDKGKEIRLIIPVKFMPLRMKSFMHMNCVLLSSCFKRDTETWTLDTGQHQNIYIDYNEQNHVLITDVYEVRATNKSTGQEFIWPSFGYFNTKETISSGIKWLFFSWSKNGKYKTSISVTNVNKIHSGNQWVFYGKSYGTHFVKKQLSLANSSFLGIVGLEDQRKVFLPTTSTYVVEEPSRSDIVNLVSINSIDLFYGENVECKVQRFISAYGAFFDCDIDTQNIIKTIKIETSSESIITNNKYLSNILVYIISIELAPLFISNIKTSFMVVLAQYILRNSYYGNFLHIRFIDEKQNIILELKHDDKY